MNDKHSRLRLSIKLFTLVFIFQISPKIIAQNANLDSLNKVVQENHISGLDLLKSGNKTEGLRKLYVAVNAFREIDYELSEKRDSIKTVIESWLKTNQESPFLNYLMGNIIYLTKRDSAGLALAKEYFNKSILLEQKFYPPYSGLASVVQFENNNEEAINNYRKIIEIDSTNYSTYLKYSSLLARIGNTSESVLLLNKIIAHDTSSYNKIWAVINLADTKKTFNEKNKLYNHALHFAKTESDSILIFSRILSASSKETTQDFITLADELLSSKIGTVRELRMYILHVYFNYLKKYNPKKILEYGNRIIEENNPLILLMIGSDLTYEKKDYENALRFLQKAYDITDSESVYETILHGKRDEKKLQQISKEFKYGTISTVIGKTYIELKRYNLAEEYLQKALPYAESKRNPEPLILLSKIMEEQGNIIESANLLAKALLIKEIPEQKKKLEELNAKLGNVENTSLQIREEREKKAVTAKEFTLKTLDNKVFKILDQKGKVVVLDFWATWCGPCVSVLPEMLKLFDKYSSNQNVIFQSVDINESEPTIKDFLKKKNYSFNILIANGTDIQKDYEVTAIPTLFIIDKQSKIQYKHIGFSPDDNIVESLSKEINELLLEK